MTDNVPSDSSMWATVLGAVVLSTTAILGWIGRRQIARIDEIEKDQSGSISRDELNTHVTQISTDIKLGFRDMHKRLDQHLEQHARRRTDD